MSRHRSYLTNQKGFTLPEVLMATIIIAISIVALLETLRLVSSTDASIAMRERNTQIAYNAAHRFATSRMVGHVHPMSPPIIANSSVTEGSTVIPFSTLTFEYADPFDGQTTAIVTRVVPVPTPAP